MIARAMPYGDILSFAPPLIPQEDLRCFSTMKKARPIK
ncbi:hypothetical protein PHLH4_10270 [Pseudomonas sp. St316]|nr:hypothetical protein PHLH4_10270 [Pseudomonas sp. St316]